MQRRSLCVWRTSCRSSCSTCRSRATSAALSRASPSARSCTADASAPRPGGETMIDEAMKQADQKMQKAIEVAREEFGGVRTGRASPQLLQRLTVDYYGSATPMQQLAAFSVPEPR